MIRTLLEIIGVVVLVIGSTILYAYLHKRKHH